MEKDQMNKNNQIIDETQETNGEQAGNTQTEIEIIFQRIAVDESFKKLLITNPDEALSMYNLTTTQAILIKSLSEEDLEKLTPDNLDEFFAADAAVYTPDEADLMDFEEYDPEDFEENDNE